MYELADQYVERFAALDPLAATGEGIGGHDHEMTDYSPDGAAERAEHDRATLRALATTEPTDRRRPHRRRGACASASSSSLVEYDAGERLRDLRVLGSPVQTVRMAFDLMARDTADEWQTVAERLALVPQGLSSIEAALAEGAAQGIVAARRQAVACTQAGRHLGRSGRRHPTVLPHPRRRVRRVGPRRPRVPRPARAARRRAPPRRTPRSAGSSSRSTRRTPTEHDPVGRERYAMYSQDFNGIELDLDETYAWGWDELHRIEHAMGQVAERIIPGADVDAVIEHLETDPTRAIEGVDEFRRWNQDLLDRTVAELNGVHFDIPEPVQRVEAMIAPPGGAAAMYYTGPAEDFSRPGRTWYPTLGKTRFPLWGEVSICYHEGVPGHHLQIAQVRYLADSLSRYQRTLAGTSGHAEGWALYAERLMGELGYLEDPAFELGHAAGAGDARGARRRRHRHAPRAGHPRRTSATTRARRGRPELALPFVIERSKFPADFMASEVDRYLGLPGQAISLQGRRAGVAGGARRRRRARGGASFDLKEFHRAALDLGPMGLAQLDRELARL